MMLFARLLRLGFLPVLLSRGQDTSHGLDPCSKVAGQQYVDPLAAEACLSSFPFNETLKQNVLSVVSGALDFYTWEAHYLELPEPFHNASWDIRAEIRRINQTRYDVSMSPTLVDTSLIGRVTTKSDYLFNRDLYDVLNRLYDGHTGVYFFSPNGFAHDHFRPLVYLPHCYLAYFYLLPASVVLLDTGIHIAPDSDTLFDGLGHNFTSFYEEKGVDWKRLAGARVLEIEGRPAWEYIDYIADNVAGDILDHNARTNLAFSTYFFDNSTHLRLFGLVASRNFLMETSLELSVVPVNSTSKEPERVKVPFVASYLGEPFEDKNS